MCRKHETYYGSKNSNIVAALIMSGFFHAIGQAKESLTGVEGNCSKRVLNGYSRTNLIGHGCITTDLEVGTTRKPYHQDGH